MSSMMLTVSQVVGLVLPLVVWTVVLGVGAVTLRRSKMAGTLLLLAGALSLGVLFINVAVMAGMMVMGSTGTMINNIELYLIAKNAGTVLLQSLVHVMLLAAVFWGREPQGELGDD